MGLQVNVGVRPEDLVLTKKDTIFTGTAKFTELLGEVTQVYFETGDSENQVIAKLPGIVHNLRGTELNLTAAPEKTHLFSNGQSLLYRDIKG